MSDNTQLTTATGYNTKRMIFSDPQVGSIPNSVPPISYQRISLQTRNEDGTSGDLILPTCKGLFSFGVSENTNPETKKVNGYVMPVCLWNRDGASKEEKEWTTTFNNIIDACKEHLITNRENIGQYELEQSDLKKFNPLYYKKEKGKVVPGTGPTLYAKLIVSKKQNKIVSMFYDMDDQPIDPLNLLGKYCFVNAAIKIESIFIGNKISMQIKLYECDVKLMENGMKRLLRPKAKRKVLVTSGTHPLDSKDNGDGSDDDGSIKGSDDDGDPVSAPVTVKKKMVKRRVKKVVRKAA
jgi:hypothetical protein